MEANRSIDRVNGPGNATQLEGYLACNSLFPEKLLDVSIIGHDMSFFRSRINYLITYEVRVAFRNLDVKTRFDRYLRESHCQEVMNSTPGFLRVRIQDDITDRCFAKNHNLKDSGGTNVVSGDQSGDTGGSGARASSSDEGSNAGLSESLVTLVSYDLKNEQALTTYFDTAGPRLQADVLNHFSKQDFSATRRVTEVQFAEDAEAG